MPHPSTHLTPRGGPCDPDPRWTRWDAAWTRHLPTLTGRTDLTVVVAPGAGGGAPACHYPHASRIEVDATHIGDPKITDPRRAGHKKLVPTAYGLLVHEAAHAVHSRWRPPPGTPPILTDVADLLEESRAEAHHRQRRRADRRWLRHTVTTLITPDEAPVDDLWHAGQLAGLLLARVDARILTPRDVRGIRAAVTGVLGHKRLRQLREVWRAAHTCTDTDATGMIRLARRWCQILGIDPDHHRLTPVADEGIFPGRLAAALTGYLATDAGLTPGEYTDRQVAARHGAPATWRRRAATDAEQRAARRLAARLHHARSRQPEPATTPATAPPGRLRTRQAVTADAQRAAGAMPTAPLWQRRTTRPPVTPSLRLAVLVDVSGSMGSFAAPMSSAAWILAHAARRGEATTTTIAFGDTVTLLVPPGQRPTHVLDMRAIDSTERFCEAVTLADRLLDLRRPTGVRMMVVVSDGCFDPATRDAGQKLITTLHQAGCAVLWLRPDTWFGHTFDHTTTITVTDPVAAIDHIADAATCALAHA